MFRTILLLILAPVFAILGFIVDLFRSKKPDDDQYDEFGVSINKDIRF